MPIQLGNGLPSTLTAARIKSLLALAESDERIFREALDAKASPAWMATNCVGEFYERLRMLVTTVEGRKAYEDASGDFENTKGKRRQRADFLQQIMEDSLKETRSQSETIGDSHNFDGDSIQHLAEAGSWGCLAELVWAVSLIRKDGAYLFDALVTYPDIVPFLEDVEASLLRIEDGEHRLVPGAEGGDTTELVDRVKQVATQLDADRLNELALRGLFFNSWRLFATAKTHAIRYRDRSLLTAQVEGWEKKHADAISGADAVASIVDALKTQIEHGATNQKTVASVLDTAERILTLEAEYREAQKTQIQAVKVSDFKMARSLLDKLESLDAERQESLQAINDLVAEARSKPGRLPKQILGTEHIATPSGHEIRETGPEAADPELSADKHTSGGDHVTEAIGEQNKAQPDGERKSDNSAAPSDSPANQEDRARATNTEHTKETLDDPEDEPALRYEPTIKLALERHRFGIAYHLALASPDALPSANTVKLVACNYVTDKSVPIGSELSDIASALLNDTKTIENEANQPGTHEDAVLITCAALAPALDAPGGPGAQLLSALEAGLGDTPSLRALAKNAAAVSITGVDLPISLLRENDSIDRWRERATALRNETNSWISNERQSTIKYQAATNVWKRMLADWQNKDRFSLGHLFALFDKPAEQIDTEHVIEITKFWRGNREKEIDRIDRENRRRASTKRIERAARSTLTYKMDQALSFSDRWLSLIQERPDKKQVFPKKQAKILRTAVNAHARQALAEIESMAIPLRACAKDLFSRYADLFASSETEGQTTVSLTDLLNGELFAEPSIEFDSAGKVASAPLDPSDLSALLDNDELDFAEAAINRASRRDFQGAEATLDFAERIGQINEKIADSARDRIEKKRSLAQQELEKMIRKSSDRLDAAYAAGALTLET